MTAQLSDPDLALSAAMRDGSRAEHEAAEASAFVGELLAGRVGATRYTAYLLRLRLVYDALEETGRAHQHDPLVSAVHDGRLARLAALDADLDHWAPGGRRDVDSPAAHAYADRIRRTAQWGGLYLAHHYTRYLGDLSGGRTIGRVLDRELGLRGRGVAFYDFPLVPKPKLYKDAYRTRLDGLALSGPEQDRVVAEVQVAFRLNRAMFAELAER